jgi:hypothetical protein
MPGDHAGPEHPGSVPRPAAVMQPRTQYSIAVSLLILLLGVGLSIFLKQGLEPRRVLPATVDRDCAPWDGAAFRISIPYELGSALEISIWKSPESQAPVAFSFPDPTGSVGEAFYRSPFGTSQPLTGRVAFWQLGGEHPIEGDFSFVTADGRDLSGSFQAVWGRTSAVCG